MVKTIETEQYSAVELYEMVLSGTINRFPRNFWRNEFSLSYASEVGFYIVEKHFHNDDSMILKDFGNKFINDIRLHTILRLFDGKAFAFFDFLYPNRFRPWQFNSCPNSYWNTKTAIVATKWLFEERLGWNLIDIKRGADYKLFENNHLGGMLAIVYNDSIYDAIDAAYPLTFKPWELNRVPVNFWKKRENVVCALHWLFDDVLHWSHRDIESKLSRDTFYNHGLSGIFRWQNGIPYGILQEEYPSIDWASVMARKQRYKKNVKITEDL